MGSDLCSSEIITREGERVCASHARGMVGVRWVKSPSKYKTNHIISSIFKSTGEAVLTASIEFKRSAGSFLNVLSFLGFPAVFSNIESPSQMTPIAVCPGVHEELGYV